MMSQLDYRSLFSVIRTPLLVLDEKLSIVALNYAYMCATGIREESVGCNLFEVFSIHSEDTRISTEKQMRVSLQRVLDTGVVDEMPITKYGMPLRNPSTVEFEERFWKPTNTPVFNSEGKIAHILHHVEDMTELVRAKNRGFTASKTIEQRLAHESHKLETIFQETPAAMALWRGPDFVFEKVNPQYQAIFPDRELIGKPFLEACPEFVGLPFIDYLRDVLATGKPFIGKEEYAPLRPQKDGPLEDRYYDFTYLRINDAEGRPYGIYDHAVDVTDRVKARKDLEFEQLKLKTVVENSTASIAVLRGENFIYELTNKSYAELFNSRELLGLPLLTALPELADQEFPRHAKSVFDTGIPYAEREALALLKRTDDGPMEERYFDQVYSRILDRNGKPYGIFMLAQEVTDRVKARMALELSQTQAEAERQKLASMIEVSPVGIGLMRGHDLVFEMVNDQFIGLVGDRNYIGRKWQDVYAELPDSPLIAIMRDVLATGKPYSAYEMPLRVEVAPGLFEERYYDFTYAQVKDGEKNPFGIYLQCSNVTERVVAKKQLEENMLKLEKAKYEAVRLREEAERANELKSSFLANMSHEIRTPLGVILGFSGLLKDRTLEAEEKDQYIDTIVRNGISLTKIIDDILDLAKVEAGKLNVESVPFSLYALATDAVDLFKDKTKAKDIYLLLNIDDDVPTRVCSDPTRLRQILVNLIGNAVKFTSKGGIRVTVRATVVNDLAKITIDVKDTGIGLDSGQKDRLFEPFTQADNSMTRKFGGTGLGLALSQRLSKALSGEISISESKPGQGSTFTLTFHAALPKDLIAAPMRAHVATEAHSLRGLRILVVDDSSDNQLLVARMLTKNGAIVETALDGQEGYDKAMSDAFDVILLDIQMPNMDGYQAKLALDRNGYIKPVIALTAHAMSEERAKTTAAGFAAHLTKPLVASDLLKTVASFGRDLY